MNLLPMKELRCSDWQHCGHTTSLPSSTLEKAILYLPESAKVSDQIIYLCPLCKHFGFVDIPTNSVPRDPHQQPLTGGKSAYLVQIECAVENCGSRIAVLAMLMKDTDFFQGKVRMDEWIDDGATCQCEHPPKIPFASRGVVAI